MKKNLFVIIIFLSTFSNAASSFKADLSRLKEALGIHKLSTSELDSFQNPYIGQTQFRLREKNAPWAGNYFSMKDGGIAQRWQSPDSGILNLDDKPTKNDILRMTAEQINKLSPAEKYDIYRGDYSFAVTEHELLNRGPLREPKPENWEGFCNGVRCAGNILPEPENAITLISPDGVKVTFQAADLKALAGASYFFVEKYAQMGSPTTESHKAEDQPNAAAFDMTLRYFLAKKKKPFVIDASLDSEIWNETVVGYIREISEPYALSSEEKSKHPRAVFKAEVSGHLETLGEIDIQETNTATKALIAQGNRLTKVPIRYTLFLDSRQNIIDGVWHPAVTSQGVDFVWFGAGRGTDAEYGQISTGNESLDFSVINKLVKKSSRGSCRALLNPTNP